MFTRMKNNAHFASSPFFRLAASMLMAASLGACGGEDSADTGGPQLLATSASSFVTTSASAAIVPPEPETVVDAGLSGTDASSSASVATLLAPLASTQEEAAATKAAIACRPRVGVNLAGAEFGNVGDKYLYGYVYPDAATLNYFQSRGVTLIRLPIRWERVQPVLMGALDAAEIGRIVTVLDQAKARGMVILVDLHNYARFNGKVMGTSQLPIETMADFWVRFAQRFAGHAGLEGYGLMNEPNNLPNATIWPRAAQLAVNTIRTVDKKTRIYVSGDQWTSAAGWEQVNANLAIRDPNNNFRYEAHQYFDPNGSGKYTQSYAAAKGTASIGVERLQPFLNFLKRTNSKGFIGEVGVPTADPAYHVTLDNFLRAATNANLEVTYWAAGVWWKNYALSVQPIDGVDKPQWSVISKYIPPAGKACR